MSKNLKIISLIVLLIGLPMLTSWLLDIQFISQYDVRAYLIYLLMLIEIFLILIIIIDQIKRP